MEHTKDRKQVLRIGIGEPLGSGKTALVDGLSKSLRWQMSGERVR